MPATIGNRWGHIKTESAVSLVLAAIALVTAVALERHWERLNLGEMADSAEDYLLTKAGIQGEISRIQGYELLRTYRLGTYRAGLYRVSPAPLVFALSRFVLYDNQNHPVLRLDGIEGSQEPWTRLYDFAGRDGIPPAGRHRAVYLRDLTADRQPDIVIGQYSGGARCCTTVTVVELGSQTARVVGKLRGLTGLPFEGLEIRHLDREADWKLIAHRPYPLVCGPADADADAVSVYAYAEGTPGTAPAYSEATHRFSGYLEEVLRRNSSRWNKGKERSLALLETVALNYVALGRQQEGEAFFASNLIGFLPQLTASGADPNVCQARFENLAEEVASAMPRVAPTPIAGVGR